MSENGLQENAAKDEPSLRRGSGLTDRSLAVALITLARHLARKDPSLALYLRASLAHAEAANLTSDDLAALKLVMSAIGG